MIIKRKLHNLRREKKAFRAVGLILGALLICWLPFFVTLPLISILKHHGFIKDENTENTWFKITFWLGYCNSAVRRGFILFAMIFFIFSPAQSICLCFFQSCNTSSISSSDLSSFLLLYVSKEGNV